MTDAEKGTDEDMPVMLTYVEVKIQSIVPTSAKRANATIPTIIFRQVISDTPPRA
jgi:hypothetical protein